MQIQAKNKGIQIVVPEKKTEEFDRLNGSYKPHPWIFSDAVCYETQSLTCFDHSFRLIISPEFNKVYSSSFFK